MSADPDAESALRSAIEAYRETGDQEFLDRAIAVSGDVADDCGFRDLSRDNAAILWSLGGAARIYRSRLGGRAQDLDDAVTWCRGAFEAAAGSDTNRPSYASNLALILVERYERDGEGADLDEAIGLFDWAVPALRAAGGRVSVALHNQGLALTERYASDHDLATLDRAIDVLHEAAADATEPPEVIGGHLNSLGLALRAKAEAASDTAALNEAVRVLRQAREWTAGSADHVAALVSLGNTLLDRSEIERPVPDLEESAACLEEALALVAAGTPRWGRIASNLANTLVATFRLPRDRQAGRAAAGPRAARGRGRRACRSGRSRDRAQQPGGLALIVRPDGARAETVWLPALTEAALAGEVRRYRDAYQNYLDSPRAEPDRTRWESAIDAVTAFAWDALMGPLLTALGAVPRVTLVPIGLLGVLPLHAAWTPDPGSATGRRYALDLTAVTYAPNARALAAARARLLEIRGEHFVAVDEPDLGAAGSRASLPHSALEVAAAVATFGDHEILSGRAATAEDVLAALARAQCFHLSCHGRADPANPLSASLAMANGTPLTLRDVLDRRLSARVGILSACETAIPGDDLPDEVVSLPAGLIQAGVATAVASLWSVPSAATALLMFRFYERWRVRGDEPSAALRDAQRWLRDTTNGEKISYFEDLALDDGHPMADAAREPYELLFRAAADPVGRDYASPYQ